MTPINGRKQMGNYRVIIPIRGVIKPYLYLVGVHFAGNSRPYSGIMKPTIVPYTWPQQKIAFSFSIGGNVALGGGTLDSLPSHQLI